MKKELLSPAGNMECLMAAVHAGADAIYIGGKKFGARAFATNFDREELISAVKYCHLYGVKLYVTVNTLIYEEEMNSALDYVRFLNEIGIDAVIVQDIGLIRNIKEYLPNMEVHASTQCHNYSSYQFKILEKLGVTRVVLARELSLNEIESIDTLLEKEVFIHGAICISYSGQCLFSSLVMNRSGNRGECAGMCRLPFNLVDQNKNKIETSGEYLLSTKELSTIERFKELMESDITSFKIEGRMKSPEYVYLVTKIYKTLMNKYYNNEEMTITEEEYNNLKIIFNREFTLGHLFKETGNNLMNIKTPNNIGIHLGNVIDINKNKISIRLDNNIYQEDGIRFVEENKGMIINFLYDKNNNLINSAKSGEVIKIDNKIGIKNHCEVRKTSSNKLTNEILNYPYKRIAIQITCSAYLNKNIELIIEDGTNIVKEYGNIVEEATSSPIDKERIKLQLEKLGNTPFISKNTIINMDDNIFISIKELNELRRKAIEKITLLRENSKKKTIIKEKPVPKITESKSNRINISCLVRTKEQLETCIDNNIDNIYITNETLYNEYKDKYKNLYYRIPRVDKTNKKYINENLLVTDLSNIEKYKNNTLVSDYHFNVVNSTYIDYLIENNVNKICISVENNIESIRKLNNKDKLEVLIYGRIELMVMNHCILNMLVNKENMPCNSCSKKYYLQDRNNELYPIVADNKTNQILNYKNKVFTDADIIELKNISIRNFRIDFFDEGKEEAKEIIKKYKNLLHIDDKI